MKGNVWINALVFFVSFLFVGIMAAFCGRTGFASVVFGCGWWSVFYVARAMLGFVMVVSFARLLANVGVVKTFFLYMGRHSMIIFGLNLPISVICLHYIYDMPFTPGFWLNQHNEPAMVAIVILIANIVLSAILVRPLERMLSFCSSAVGKMIGDL